MPKIERNAPTISQKRTNLLLPKRSWIISDFGYISGKKTVKSITTMNRNKIKKTRCGAGRGLEGGPREDFSFLE